MVVLSALNVTSHTVVGYHCLTPGCKQSSPRCFHAHDVLFGSDRVPRVRTAICAECLMGSSMWASEGAKIARKFTLHAIPTRWEILVGIAMGWVSDVMVLANVSLCYWNHSWGCSFRMKVGRRGGILQMARLIFW